MRMRRKHHLEERIDACDKNLLLAVQDNGFYMKNEEEKYDIFDLSKVFCNNRPVYLELGCGKGGFAIEYALSHPEINILAVEKISNVIIEGVEAAEKRQLTNLKFINCGAENLKYYLKPHTVSRIFLNFSCPYPKNTYANRRLTNVSYLEIYKEFMTQEAEIHQKTDNMKLFEYSLQSFSENGFTLKNISLDLHNSYFKDNIETEYEKHFSALGKPIYRLEAYLKTK